MSRVASYTVGGQTRTNGYNGDGVLVAQTVGSTTTRYSQDLITPLNQILNSGGTTYFYGLDRLASSTSGAKTWYATDAIGSVRRTLNDAGASQPLIDYDAWGVVQRGSVPTFGYAGEQQDGSLLNLRARWYNASKGSFSRIDPFPGFEEKPYSLHQYAYGLGNPVSYTDPTGKCVAEGGGPRACNPDFQSALRAYLRDPYSFEQRARADRGYEALNVVFDAYPDEARTYNVAQDADLRQYVTHIFGGEDPTPTLVQLDFVLQQWKLDDAQRRGQPIDVLPYIAGAGAMAVLIGPDCAFGPLDGKGASLGAISSNTIKLTRERAEHILQGASRPPAKGGGHASRFDLEGTLGPEGPNQFEIAPKQDKTYFDASLSDEDILKGVIRIANEPASYSGGVIPVGKKPGSKFTATGYINDFEVEVIIEPKGRGIVTAYPTGRKR